MFYLIISWLNFAWLLKLNTFGFWTLCPRPVKYEFEIIACTYNVVSY